MLTGKTIVLGVTGSIAAYKTAMLASLLVKQHADVHVLMTANAVKFVCPLTFETLTNNKCIVDTFDRNFSFDVKHISLAKKADLFMTAPCSANVIGKLASGICDDMLTTTLFASRAVKLLAPAMNTGMWENSILQENIEKLKRHGYVIVSPTSGRLACGDTGNGKMEEPEILLEHILLHMAREKDMRGRRVLISAGPTQENIDPVRYITNHSSGKMGYAIAKMAALRGAEVTLVSGPVNIKPFMGIDVVNVVSAADMYEAVTARSADKDIVIMTSTLVYILAIDYDSNSFICIRKFSDLIIPYQSPDLLEMKNGNFIINFKNELIYFSKSYEIISNFKIIRDYIDIPDLNYENQFYDMIKLNNENIIFGNMGNSYHLNTTKFNFSFFEISEPVSFGINDNILGKTYNDYFTLFDYKLNKSVYQENFDDPYYWIDPKFILFDKSKNIFGFFSNSNSSNLYIRIFQINKWITQEKMQLNY